MVLVVIIVINLYKVRITKTKISIIIIITSFNVHLVCVRTTYGLDDTKTETLRGHYFGITSIWYMSVMYTRVRRYQNRNPYRPLFWI